VAVSQRKKDGRPEKKKKKKKKKEGDDAECVNFIRAPEKKIN